MKRGGWLGRWCQQHLEDKCYRAHLIYLTLENLYYNNNKKKKNFKAYLEWRGLHVKQDILIISLNPEHIREEELKEIFSTPPP